MANSETISFDLKKISGIGGQTARRLTEAGIADIIALAEARNLKEIKKQTGYSMKNLNKWQERAQKYVEKAEKAKDVAEFSSGVDMSDDSLPDQLQENLDNLSKTLDDVKSSVDIDDTPPVTGVVHEDSDSVSGQTPPVTGTVPFETEVVQPEGTMSIPTEKLIRFPGNQRFDPKFGLETLLENIKRNGIKYPLVVCPVEDEFYEVIDGERRRTCAVELSIKEVICRVENLSEKEKWEMAYTLNDTIRPFSTMEKAMAAYERKKRFHLTNEELGDFLGVKITQVGKLISLNKLPEEIQSALHQGEIGLEAAYELSRLAFDVDFPNPGTSIDEAIHNGIQWDFDWDPEPENWAVHRTRLQLELLRDIADNRISVGDLRGRVRDAINTEKELREAIAKAEKEAAEKAEQERTDREKKHTALQTEIDLKQQHLDEAITTYIKHSKNFEKETGIELDPVGLKDPDDYKKVLNQGFMDFENLFGPKTPPVPMTWADALKKLKAFDDTDSIEFRDERRCIHCGAELRTEDAQVRQIFIEALEGEIEAIKERKKSIQVAREELFKKHQAIRSSYYALDHLKIELKNLEDQMAADAEGSETDLSGLTMDEAKAKMAELKEQINERLDDVIEAGNKILREETDHQDPWAQYQHDLQCARCGGTIKRGEPFEEAQVFEDNKEVTKFMHKTCPEPTEQTNECPWCSKEINEDQDIADIPVFVNGVEKSLQIHDSCYDALLDAPCAGCDDPIGEEEPSVFVLDEDTVMRYHANCALVNELIPDFSSASDMNSEEEDWNCPLCNQEIEDGEKFERITIFEDKVPKSYKVHEACLVSTVIDKECPACDEKIRDGRITALIMDEKGQVNRWHADCALEADLLSSEPESFEVKSEFEN